MSIPRPLRTRDLTPEVMIQYIAANVKNYRQMYAVCFDQCGDPVIYSTGDLGGVAYAALALQDLAIKVLNKRVIVEGDDAG